MNWSIKKFLAETYDFAGEPKQKPGDQVRGTEKAKKTGYEPGTPYKKHPFQGRLVGGSSESVKHDDLEGQYLDEFERFMNSAQGEEDLEEAPLTPTVGTMPQGQVGQQAQQPAPASPQEKAKAAQALNVAKQTLQPTGVDPTKLAKGLATGSTDPNVRKIGQQVAGIASDPALAPKLKQLLTTQQRTQK